METLNTIVTALALGALGRQWAQTHESVNQLYLEMKNRLGEQYPSISLAKLEESPQSGGVRFLLKEDLSNIGASDEESLLKTGLALINAVKAHNPELLEKLALRDDELKE